MQSFINADSRALVALVVKDAHIERDEYEWNLLHAVVWSPQPDLNLVETLIGRINEESLRANNAAKQHSVAPAWQQVT